MKKRKKLGLKKITLRNLDEPMLFGGAVNTDGCTTGCTGTCTCPNSLCVGGCGNTVGGCGPFSVPVTHCIGHGCPTFTC